MSYLIRQAAIDDLSAICNVENTCFPPAEAATKEAFRSRITTFPERFLVAEDQGRIIGLINGCCTTEPVLGDELYEENCPHSLSHPWQTVFGLAVLPEYQHRGIARALMAHLVRLCQSGSQVGIILTCKQEKIGFYESMGFACRGVSDSSHGGARWFDMVLSL
jgi:ribosomal protein S18 acetylase RimI-like enzyme